MIPLPSPRLALAVVVAVVAALWWHAGRVEAHRVAAFVARAAMVRSEWAAARETVRAAHAAEVARLTDRASLLAYEVSQTRRAAQEVRRDLLSRANVADVPWPAGEPERLRDLLDAAR